MVRELEKLLTMKIGRREFFDLWFDPRLSGNEPVTPLITGRVRDSAVFLLFLSQSYLTSIWTMQELKVFYEEIRRRNEAGGRVFVVEFDKVERPAELAELRGYRFWAEDTLSQEVSTLGFPTLLTRDEERYYKLVTEICGDMVAELNLLKSRSALGQGIPPEPGVPHPEVQVPGTEPPAVFLADVTDDLEDLRDGVKSYLMQAGYRILPQTIYPLGAEGYRDAAQADLEKSILFVQLLSELPGRKFDDEPDSRRAAVLFQCAAERQPPIPIMQWRSRDINWAKVTNPAHLQVLKGATLPKGSEVMEVDIEDFKAAVKVRMLKLTTPPPPARPPINDLFMFINSDSADDPVARSIESELAQWPWIGVGLPLRDGTPTEIREDLEQNLLDCDAMMLIFGAAHPRWARSQLQLARKLTATRPMGSLPVALYEAPPPETKELLGYRLPHMERLNCRSGPNPAELRRYVEILRPNGGGQ